MRIVILANGTPPSASELASWLRSGDQLACADGGAACAIRHGAHVHIAIGDFDSLTPKQLRVLESSGTQLVRHAREKEQTDLELVLMWAAQQQAAEVIVLGAHGGRTDQFIANLMLLALPALRAIAVTVVAGPERVRLLSLATPLTIHGAPGDTVSLLPIGGDASGITTHGLRYALTDDTLVFGPARGVSNVMTSAEAGISLTAGLLLCIHRVK